MTRTTHDVFSIWQSFDNNVWELMIWTEAHFCTTWESSLELVDASDKRDVGVEVFGNQFLDEADCILPFDSILAEFESCVFDKSLLLSLVVICSANDNHILTVLNGTDANFEPVGSLEVVWVQNANHDSFEC